MANLVLNGSVGKFTWQITDLGNVFSNTYYTEAGITSYVFTDNSGKDSIDGITSTVLAPSSSSNKYTPVTTVTYSPGTYTFYGFARAANGKYYPAGSATVTVTGYTLSVSNITSTGVTITVGGVSAGDSVRIQIYNPSTGTRVVNQVYTATKSSLSQVYTNLSPSTFYYVDAKVNSDPWIGGDSYADGTPFTTLSQSSSRPSDWSWTSTIASGGTISLTAKEWNDFCTRINAFRTYKGMSSYSFTTAISGSTQISASICNQAWSAINAISGHGTMPSQAVQGGPLYASFFTGLRNALNAIS